jgi:HTH-type transcriptional regulator/antitoxin HigA
MRYGTNTIAIPPGATIREQLENRRLSQKEFAIRMNLSEKHISRLINGQVELTKDVALRLEAVLGLSAGFWNNLEMIYRENLSRVKEENELEDDIKLAGNFPYSKMAALGWVTPSHRKEDRVLHLRRFFEVASLGVLDELMIPGIAGRRMNQREKSNYHLAVWAQKARLVSRQIETRPINLARLEQSIDLIRDMTTKAPDHFYSNLQRLFSDSGVAFVCLPHIGGSFLHGASFHDGNRIVLGLTLRGKDADRFWFSLFHELCHVLRGHITGLSETNAQHEIEADDFARDILIPPTEYKIFIKDVSFSREKITAFADSVHIEPGIVVGRLQNDNYITYDRYNDLKVKYEFI